MLLYTVMHPKLKNIFLIAASLVFFGWADMDHIPLLLIFIVVNYIAAKLIAKTKKRIFLIAGVTADITLLVTYKYADFLIWEFNKFTGAGFELLDLLIPLGISFLVFQAVSLLMDIYRGDAEAGSFTDIALYLVFFPKLVSGPLVRYCDFAPQLHGRRMNVEKISSGIERIIIGLAKKVIIADTLGVLVDSIFNDFYIGIDVPTAWIGALCYMMQIYLDFSGYSDCAIGIASVFGFDFKDNFNFPYTSTSITEFWRRWHISLGSWFRNYLYFPMGGSRRGNVYFNLFIVFLATGIWHGAGAKFIIWGLVNALFVLIERRIWDTGFYQKIPAFIKWAFSMAVVFFNWILFRAENLSECLGFIGRMFGFGGGASVQLTWEYYLDARILVFLIICVIGSTIAGKFFYEKVWQGVLVRYKAGYFIKIAVLTMLFAAAAIFMVNSTYNPFIYFRF